MSLSDLIKAVSTEIEQQTGTTVTLGPPNGQASGLTLWPWRIKESSLSQPSPALGSASGNSAPPPAPLSIHFLIAAQPPFEAGSIARLERVYQIINATPILTSGSSSARLTMESLGMEDLTALFASAGQPMSACVCVQAELINGGQS